LLNSKGYPIANIFDDVNYDENKLNLNIGDKLFLYTDGITEARNRNNEQFGIENLLYIIKKDGDILGNLSHYLNDFCKMHKDDYAMLMAEII
jgi:sigma-B regulation protein RsbU (phosphoserine phosphatase)